MARAVEGHLHPFSCRARLASAQTPQLDLDSDEVRAMHAMKCTEMKKEGGEEEKEEEERWGFTILEERVRVTP